MKFDLNALKRLFVYDTEAKPTADNPTTADAKPDDTKPPVVNASPVAGGGTIDEKITSTLLQAIESNNLDGFDYLEYKKSLQALANLPMDEATKYRSAFATASTMGISLSKLLESATYYVQILEREKNTFDEALKGKSENDVQGKRQEQERLRQALQQKAETIQRLTEEMKRDQSAVDEIDQYIASITQKLAQTKNNFEVSYQNIYQQMDNDIQKIKQYLS
ncbi:MAG: hypothetical protein IPL35_14385 [Sphingobacteriales bacterium]|nr:hypothetical protein [Sphingobacteriales bacterium]